MTRDDIIKASGGIVVLVVCAFLLGRVSKQPQVVTRDVIKTQTVEVEKVHTVTVHDQAEAKAAEVRTVTVTKYRWLPGGITEAEATTTKDSDTHETRQQRTTGTQDRAVDVRTQTIELHTVTPVRPRWSVSLMPGAQLFGAKAITLWGPAVLGASVERRIAGPVSIGLWGSTSGAAGITLRGDL